MNGGVLMSGTGVLKVYRPPFFSLALGWLFAGFWFLLGLSMVTIGPSQRDWGSVGVGVVVLLIGLWTFAVLATNRLIVTPAGVACSYYLRRRVVGWAEVQSFGVGRSRGTNPYPTVVIHRKDGSVLVTNLSSFTRKYPARIADELTAWQHRLAPASLGQLP